MYTPGYAMFYAVRRSTNRNMIQYEAYTFSIVMCLIAGLLFPSHEMLHICLQTKWKNCIYYITKQQSIQIHNSFSFGVAIFNMLTSLWLVSHDWFFKRALLLWYHDVNTQNATLGVVLVLSSDNIQLWSTSLLLEPDCQRQKIVFPKPSPKHEEWLGYTIINTSISLPWMWWQLFQPGFHLLRIWIMFKMGWIR